MPQRERIHFGYGNHVSRTYVSKFHPDTSTLSVFQDFRFPPPGDIGGEELGGGNLRSWKTLRVEGSG